MRPRLTWRNATWLGAGWVTQPAQFAARHGSELARVVASYRQRTKDSEPRAVDVRCTLEAIRDRPLEADPGRAGSLVESLLCEACWARGWGLSPEALDPRQLATVADDALRGYGARPSGRPSMRPIQVAFVRALLVAGAGTRRGQALHDLVSEALIAAGLVRQLRTTCRADADAALHRTVAELIRKARRAG